MSVVTVPLGAFAAITPRSRLLTLDVSHLPFAFLPGQAVMLGASGVDERRPYSIASSPERTRETGALEVLIAVDAAGDPGPHLPRPSPGMRVEVEGPFGSFVFPAAFEQRRVLFVAGGTGIAPLRSMADHLLRATRAYQASLLYSARARDEFAFIDEFRAHASAGRLELHQTVTREEGAAWMGGRGRIGHSHFEAVLHDPADTLCFVCGPPALVSESVATLRLLGVPADLIRTEAWERRPSERVDAS